MRTPSKFIVLSLILLSIFSTRIYLAQIEQGQNVQSLLDNRQQQETILFGDLVRLNGRVLDFAAMEYAAQVNLVDQVAGEHLMPESIGPAGQEIAVDSVWLVKPDGSLLPGSGKDALPVSPFPSAAWDQFTRLSGQIHFFARLPDGSLLEVAGAPVGDPGAPEGFLFVGMQWDEAHLKDLARQVDGTVQVIDAAAPVGKPSLESGFTARLALNGWDGATLPVALEARFTDPVLSAFNALRYQELVTYLFVSILVFLILALALYLWVGRPLGSISRSLRENNLKAIERFLKTQDEFGNIARLIERSINQQADLDKKVQRLSALNTINVAVSASLDLGAILSVLVDQVTSYLGASAADVLLADPGNQDLCYRAGSGFRTETIKQTRLWFGEGQAGQVALERCSKTIENSAGIAGSFLPARSLEGEDFVAYFAVPLIIQGEVRGVLETFHRSPYTPDPDWLRFLEALAAGVAIAIKNADLLDQLRKSNLELKASYDATIESWSRALEIRDYGTETHTRRVAQLTQKLAQMLRITGDELVHIYRGALLHDIGKIMIPDAILKKPGPLTDEEWTVMRRHPSIAKEMLSSIPFLHPALDIPYSHHERWDGSGYPRGLCEKQIPLSARIFSVIDVWDAMTFERVYREALPEEEVLAYLQREAGRLFDPHVVAAFIHLRKISHASE